jgi:hypothetical protein
MASISTALSQDTEDLFARLRPSPFTTNISEHSTGQEAPQGDHIEPTAWIAPGSLDGIDLFADTIRPPVVVTSLPSLPDDLYPQGSFAFLTGDQKLYRNTDGSTWSAAVDSGDITGHVGIPIAASDPALPDATYPTGSFYLNSVDKHLRKTINGTTWILAVDAGDIVSNSITAGQIAAGTITATEIAALTITAAQIAADTITAGQIAAGAISASELAALSVTAAKLNILDAAGATVLTGAGFGGSWLDFLAEGFYNGHFGYGTTNNITAATIVGTAGTDADYLASASVDIPPWIISAESGAGTFKRVADTDAVGGYALEWSGSEDASIFQDIPVLPNRHYRLQVNRKVMGSGAAVMDFEYETQFRTSTHAAIGAGVIATEIGDFTDVDYYVESPAISQADSLSPSNARYFRVTIRAHRVSGSPSFRLNSVNAVLDLFGEVYIGAGSSGVNSSALLRLTDTDGLQRLSSGGIYMYDVDGDTYPTIQLRDKAMIFGSGGASAPDIYIARSNTKTLTIDSDAAGTALTATRVSGPFVLGSANTFDTWLYRSAAKTLTLDSDGAGTALTAVNLAAATPLKFSTDAYIRRSAAKTLTLDSDGAGGGLTLVDVKGDLTVSGGLTVGGFFFSAGTLEFYDANNPFMDWKTNSGHDYDFRMIYDLNNDGFMEFNVANGGAGFRVNTALQASSVAIGTNKVARYVALTGISNPLNSTTAATIGATLLELTAVPSTGVVAVNVRMYCSSTTANTGNWEGVSSYVNNNAQDAYAFAGAVANYVGTSTAVLATGGTNNRQIYYTVNRGAGTVTYVLSVLGYWTTA